VSCSASAPGVLVLTGASGFIGSALLDAALCQGWRVRVLTRSAANWTRHHPLLEVFEGDLAVPQDWSRLVIGSDLVVNAAAEILQDHLMDQVNVTGPLNLLHAAVRAGVGRWVQLSSVGAYGPVHAGQVTEQWPDQPVGAYETTKTEFDRALKAACLSGSTQYCIVRPSNVYGPNMRNQSIHQMIHMIRKGWFVFMGSPGASANYVHVDDVVNATSLCMSHPKAANQTYIVSAWDSIENMVQAIALNAGVTCPNKRLNLRMAVYAAKLFQKWPGWPLTLSRIRALSSRSRYATEKIESELGWRASVSVAQGMKQMTMAKSP
jgi:nucleoside-diphosphate-sugar epimerase